MKWQAENWRVASSNAKTFQAMYSFFIPMEWRKYGFSVRLLLPQCEHNQIVKVSTLLRKVFSLIVVGKMS
ncbi:hypothetical protein AQUCO_07200014v1 [Aquilegia coerulea]|uniref:Uncharacterized protein n=1 Tax=Aquilegia coerulea TaxID=218851 RepID=A0A2G5C9Y5_AQUCA|nr:hypothetical protein AQUCO_07200014v1 [Aquilegia coerulea]